MSRPPFSVITLTHDRDDHLRGLIEGIAASEWQPDELVIIYIDQPKEVSYQTLFPIRSFHLSSSGTLPLAEARNKGASIATTNNMIFLDVDCIPSPTLFKELLQAAQFETSLVMGTPIYQAPDGSVVEHQGRAALHSGPSDHYTAFWSLCFGLTKQTYQTIGGFDSGFTGYGGEDTDFALTAQEKAVPFVISPATCLHQYHAVYKPPVQHVDDIIVNSNYFYKKWNRWPMEGWLTALADLRLLTWTPKQTEPIRKIRDLSADEIASFKDETSAY